MPDVSRRDVLALGVVAASASFLPPASAASDSVVGGVDVSWLPMAQSQGAHFRTASGRRVDPITLLAAAGVGIGRLRIFVRPRDANGQISTAIQTARRLQHAGIHVMLDLHLSDTWADPGHQSIPAGWPTTDVDRLAQNVSSYVKAVLERFLAEGIAIQWIQIGNEVGNGLLWPVGRVETGTSAEFQRLATLLNAGIDTAREISPHTNVLLHVEGHDRSWWEWWWPAIRHAGLSSVDAIGVSYYPQWHGNLDTLRGALDYIAAVARMKVFIAETAYPWVPRTFGGDIIDISRAAVGGYTFSPKGQAAYVRRLRHILRQLPGGRGKGVIWWEGLALDARNATVKFGMQNSTLCSAAGVELPALRALARG